ncbi:Auxin-responsive protein IAA26 [Hibiscus syriacus]|uniref:Auxin-responsive protein n=1 Tax=Hibiscus syriacus TaxID=106335 RepID=A0A6A2YN48_HIBSY|nr:auxin-responsive protein IAA18-like [Hibiscus syriacus]XP_039025954.1 auxin-responsive protein IAA18-like [Hibiscus syriacus]XP_039025955.1 auxin-responsive protein IAA18-like [Hibiscus syriacus]KAE8680756.1 Auxin-responsive protein IAA26 [Hibiscus syriacus]
MASGCSKNVESRPLLLDLIPQRREWHHVKREDEIKDGSSEEKKLELRLGPPGEENWLSSIRNNTEGDESLLSPGYFSSSMKNNGKLAHKFPCPEDNHPVGVGSVLSTPWGKNHHQQQTKTCSFLQFPSTTAPPNSLPFMAKESSQPCSNKVVDLQDAERKAFKPPANTAVPLNTSHKRTAPGPVVGWPPIRSIRKNLASSSKLSSDSPSVDPPQKVASEKPGAEPNGKGLFVKINMDGVPIGRKVDLKAYDSYEKLSTAVDELFRGLLAAQRDSSAGGIVNEEDGEKAITGVLDGSGEYTLIYEDNEGDSMLVGDVPWHMFVLTVKRLRALKSSELSALCLGSGKQGGR